MKVKRRALALSRSCNYFYIVQMSEHKIEEIQSYKSLSLISIIFDYIVV